MFMTNCVLCREKSNSASPGRKCEEKNVSCNDNTSLSLLLPWRLRGPHLDATGECRRGVRVEIDHRLGNVFAGKFPTVVAPASRRSPEVRIHASGHDITYPNAVVADVLHHGLAESIEPKLC